MEPKIVEGITIEKHESAFQFFLKSLVEGSDIQGHLLYLASIAQGKILEIGVRSGRSTSAFLTGVACQGGFVFSIDIEDCDIFPDDRYWTFIKGDSKTVELPLQRCCAIHMGKPHDFDLVFIDGAHDFDSCLSDLRRFGILAPRIILHDFETFAGVHLAVAAYRAEMLDKGIGYSCEVHPGSNGLAVLNRTTLWTTKE